MREALKQVGLLYHELELMPRISWFTSSTLHGIAPPIHNRSTALRRIALTLAAGFEVPIDVDWNSLALPGDAEAYAQDD